MLHFWMIKRLQTVAFGLIFQSFIALICIHFFILYKNTGTLNTDLIYPIPEAEPGLNTLGWYLMHDCICCEDIEDEN